jgi:hypothetical protein
MECLKGLLDRWRWWTYPSHNLNRGNASVRVFANY